MYASKFLWKKQIQFTVEEIPKIKEFTKETFITGISITHRDATARRGNVN